MEAILYQMFELLGDFSGLVVALFFAYALTLVAPAKKFVDENVNVYVLTILKSMAKTYVSELAQNPIWEKTEGSRKKELAVIWLMKFAEQKGYSMDADFLGKLVEEAYSGIKSVVIEVDKSLK